MDLVDVPAFEARFAGRDEVLREIFTGAELAYGRAQRRPWRHLAARFAAKEALLKALGTGLTGAMRLGEIEVVRDPAGAPRLVVSGATAAALHGRRLEAGAVSLSHTGSLAVAVVVLTPS